MSIHVSTERVIHLNRVPPGACDGKDRAVAEVEAFRNTKRDEPASMSTALANFSGNATCDRCKLWLKANKTRRERMVNYAKADQSGS